MQHHNALPTHPRTGLTAVGIIAGKPVWPILGAAEEGEGDSGDGSTKTVEPPQWSAPASQDELNRIIEDRLARERKKFSDYDTLKEKAAAHDALQLELSSDMDKATQKAADDAYHAAMAVTVPRLVTAEFRAEAKGVLTGEQLEALLEDVDLTRYADDDGEPDIAKIAAKIAKFAPAKPDDQHHRTPNFGQGARPQSKQTQREIGRAAAERRFGTAANK